MPDAMHDANAVGRGLVLLGQGMLLFAGVGFGLAVHGGAIDPYDPGVLRPLCGFLLFAAAWAFLSWRVWTGSWFDGYTIFLAAAYLFNGGQVFLAALDLLPHGLLLDDKFPHRLVVDAVLLTTLCMLGLHTGAMLAAAGTWSARARARKVLQSLRRGPTERDLRTVGWALLVISLPATCVRLAGAIRTVMESGYLGLYARDAETGIYAVPQIIGEFLVPAALFLVAGSRDSRTGRWTSLAVLVLYAACQLFLGFRYYAIMPLVAYAWVWHRCIRPVRVVPLAAIALVLAVVVFPLVRQTRLQRGDSRSVEAAAESFSGLDNPAVATIHEMGGTLMIAAYTLDLVPATREYDFGLSYFYALLTLMPNVAWDLHPSIAYGTRAQWLIWSVEPWLAARGGSFGFSFIAEAYHGFGWAGAPWVCGLIGFGFARLVLWADTARGLVPAKIAVVATFVTHFAFFAREEMAVIVRPLVWYALLPYAAIYLLAWARRFLASPAPIRVPPMPSGSIS